jgi:serine/threonine protein kinase
MFSSKVLVSVGIAAPIAQESTMYNDLSIVKKLNKAKFSVFKAYSPSLIQHFALKVFPYHNGEISPLFLNEVRFSNLDHPNVISILHHEDEKMVKEKKQNCKISYTIMELAPHNDFFDVLITKHIQFNEMFARTYFQQLINGLEYLHSQNIAHLDIKPENLLLGNSFQLKIADFDNSIINNEITFRPMGTIFYRAPELIKATCTDLGAADIYSAGIVLFLFKSGGILPHIEHQLFEGLDLLDLLNNHNEIFWESHCEKQKQLPSFFSPQFRDLFNSMTKTNPAERASLLEIKASEWFNGLIYTKKEMTCIMTQNLYL